jgi:superfamily II DNA or RNA helicase
VRLYVGNSWTEIANASPSFADALTTHLAVSLGSDPSSAIKVGTRFGRIFWGPGSAGQREMWGSLVHEGRRVASGLVPWVEALALHYREPCETMECRARPPEELPLHCVSGVRWRPYQDAVQKAILTHDRGVVDAPPRSGKTLMAARAFDIIAQPCLWLAPSIAIVQQTYDVLVRHFGEGYVARLDSEASRGQRDIERPLVVATIASALAQEPAWFKTRRMLVIDEFHHAAAESYHRLNALCEHVYYRLMWTGTHFRTGEDALAMHAVCSTVLHSIKFADLVAEGFLAPARVVFVPVRGPTPVIRDAGWMAVYQDALVGWEPRNNVAAHIARTLDMNGIPSLVLTRRRAHAQALSAMIPGSQVVMGGDGALSSRAIADFNAGVLNVLVGTQVIGEGVDVPRAAALVYAAGGNEGVQQMQSYFRPLTAHAGKSVGLIYDFIDRQHRSLHEHARARARIAEAILGERSVVRL